ncbi:MAG TPA: polysaccharide biosynthesis tyrosine autokinase [Pyrinomonadaceae bacterium]|jgi:capsular exopolysaccharide synthesis family protein
MKDSREIITTKTTETTHELERPFEPPYAASGNGNYPMYRGATAQEGFQLLDYWRAIRKRLWLVLGIAVLMTTLTAIYVARKPNIYEATARVQVDNEQANPALVGTSDRPMLPQSDPAYFNTQLQLLTSDSILRRVVKELNLDSNKDFQVAKSEDNVSTWQSMLRAVGLASKPEKKEDKGVGEVTLGSSLASSEDINEALRLAPYVDIIKKKLRIEPVREGRATFKDTRHIQIYFQHTSPELAALVVNGISEIFTKTNQEKRTGRNKETNDFLTERVATLQSEIKRDELKLAELKREAGILKKDEGQTIVIDRLAGLNKQLLDAENKRKNAEAEYNAVKSSPEKIRALAEDKMVRYFTERENDIRSLNNEVTKKIADLEAEKERLLVEYQENAPEIQEYNKKINSLRDSIQKRQEQNKKDLDEYRTRAAKDIVTNLQTRYEQAKAEEDKIRGAFNEQYGAAQGENQAAINIRLLEQNVETNRSFLKNLTEQQSSNDIISRGTDNNISVVDWALPPETPVSPRRLTTVLAALFLSTLFGAGLALFFEYLDDTIKTTEEVENFLQLPALAAIPTIDSMPKRRLLLVGAGNEEMDAAAKSELLIHTDSRSSLAEAYRQLRTSILLSTAGHAPKSLLITSSLPSEGKTTTAVNTAISLAQTGASVLIIDSDMRRPRLHSVFNISNAEGLSTILSSEMAEKEVLDIVQYEETAKLHLLPSGPVPPNPAELIGSEQMANLLKVMQKRFTHVVVDSPPIASFTDGVLIASMVDGVILVVHSGKSSRQVVRRSKQLLNDIGAKIFGVVLNNVNLRSQDNYYYYQSYYHRSNYRHDDEQQ